MSRRVDRRETSLEMARWFSNSPSRAARAGRSSRPPLPSLAVAILAGGLSTRMGREKARLRLDGKSLLAHARAAAGELGCPVRVVRRDLVPRCGPLGGVLTALMVCRAEAVVLLACDMPWVSPELLRKLARGVRTRRAVFVAVDGVVGFPFALRAEARLEVESQIERGEFSLQALATVLRAKRSEVPARAVELVNLNTPQELVAARRWRRC